MTRGIKQASAPAPSASSAELMADDASSAAPTAADALTVRDQIAMRAPAVPAWWTNTYMARTGGHSIDAQALAVWAYEYADAAMAERAK